ncbi:helix-turn-helix domain-containing protein [Mesorhizobium sp. M0019]|uniref:helix-turn-helix domain-containing protein n=1 Tax=Mesorhizobium sp. M0019 TaxID=2956845 RepID=UPI00333760E3
MLSISYRPIESIGHVVDRYWSRETNPGENIEFMPFWPSPGGAEIFFHVARGFLLNGKQPPRAYVLCCRSQPIHPKAVPGFRFLAVRIRAGMAEHLLGVPVSELADRIVPLEVIWGQEATRMTEQIVTTALDSTRVHLLNHFLQQRLNPRAERRTLDAAFRLLETGTSSISKICDLVGLSERQLENRFRRATANSPVRFRQLARLRRTIKAILQDPNEKFTQLVDEAYFDQSQAVHEFRRFTGLTPTEFCELARRSAHFYELRSPALARRSQ